MNPTNFPKKCQSYASVPVMMDSKPQDNYLEMLHRGFLLNWTSPSCSRCSESGGQCGYLENEFKCFCRDRPHLVSCKDRKSPISLVLCFLFAPVFLVMWRVENSFGEATKYLAKTVVVKFIVSPHHYLLVCIPISSSTLIFSVPIF